MFLTDNNPALIPDLLELDRYFLFDCYYQKLLNKLNDKIEETAYNKYLNGLYI